MNQAKSKILLAVLTGVERQNWINPDLTLTIIKMVRDPRFEVAFFPVTDIRPWECARNKTIQAARQIGAEWLISFDNDNFVEGNGNPLDIIASAGPEQHVIGLTYGVSKGDRSFELFPCASGATDGAFRETESVAGGVLMVRNTVWQNIPRGPWFRWQHADNELLELDASTCGEDVYFCRLVRQHGMRVWTHEQMAGHYRSVDLTGMVCSLDQIRPKPVQPSQWVTQPR